MKKDKKKDEDAEFDLGMGNISLGGLFKGFEKLVDLAADLSAKGESSSVGEIDLSHLKKGMKGVFGFSVKTAVGGKPVIEPFGNIKKTPSGPVVKEEREPLTDVFYENDEVIIMAEMPGIEEEGVTVTLKGDILEISGAGKNRKYYKEILLTIELKPENLTHTYKNGVLEIKIKK
ncbi:MAG: Hsp20/alpha crystallin family protein [Candidatus Omnitrophota bacterium]